MSENRERVPPVSIDQVEDMQCISIGKKGDGIFKFENFVIIVPETEAEKWYKVKITKVLSSIAFGEKMQNLEEAPTEEFDEEEEDDDD